MPDYLPYRRSGRVALLPLPTPEEGRHGAQPIPTYGDKEEVAKGHGRSEARQRRPPSLGRRLPRERTHPHPTP
jgi:hypothetical protein